jgi:hypothetical protein
MALVCERTIPAEQPLLVGEVSANFCGQRGVVWSCGRNLGFLDRFNRHYTDFISCSCLHLNKGTSKAYETGLTRT